MKVEIAHTTWAAKELLWTFILVLVGLNLGFGQYAYMIDLMMSKDQISM